jgi:hypothetical protein
MHSHRARSPHSSAAGTLIVDTVDSRKLPQDNASVSTATSSATSSDDAVESQAVVTVPRQNTTKPKYHTFMLFQTPTIRRRIAHIEAAAQSIYKYAWSSSSMAARGSTGALRSFNERMRATFDDLVSLSSMGTTQLRQRQIVPVTDARRSDFEKFILGVVCAAVQQSNHEQSLRHNAHETMMQRVEVAQGMLELRKAVLNKLPLCVFSKTLYPDWTSGGMWMNTRAMETLRIDPNECPNQIIPLASFMDFLSHPATFGAASAHTAFAFANQRQRACNYQLWIRRDGTRVAGVYSNHYLFGPAPLHRAYFTYVYFQPLPVQPRESDMDAWARRVMIKHTNQQEGRGPGHRGESGGVTGRGWTEAGTSAKYPGIMHALIQDHIRLHPEDEMKLPPCPVVDSESHSATIGIEIENEHGSSSSTNNDSYSDSPMTMVGEPGSESSSI